MLKVTDGVAKHLGCLMFAKIDWTKVVAKVTS